MRTALNYAILLLWPWRLLQERAEPPVIIEQPLRAGLLQELWTACPTAFATSVIATTLTWLASLGLALFISGFLEASLTGGPTIRWLMGLAVMVVLRTAARLVATAETLRLEEAMALRLGGLVRRLHLASASPERVARLVARDFRLLLDHAEGVIGLIALAVGIGSFFLYIVWAHSADMVLALGSLALFAPASIALAIADDRVFARVMTASGRRLEACRRWLHLGPVYLNWRRLKGLDQIRELTASEVRLRNLDTVLRGADTYVVNFGRVLPFALLTALLLSNDGGTPPSFESYWLALPLIGMMMDFPRSYVSFRNAGRALAELNSLQFTELSAHAESLVLDGRWQLWSGTVEDNLMGVHAHTHTVLARLGLVGELGASGDAVLALRVEPGGRNLSAGQQLRLLVARGLTEALMLGVKLRIERSLASLDRNNQVRIVELQAAFPDVIALGDRARTTLSESAEAPAYVASGERRSIYSTPGDTVAGSARTNALVCRVLSPTAALLLAPAALVGYVGHVVYEPISWWTLGLLFGSVPAGILAGVGLGLVVERGVRAQAQQMLISGLGGITEGVSIEDRFQMVSRDFDTVNERVAWYLHDIVWMAGLATVAVLSALLVIGPATILIGVAVAGGYAWLWRVLVPLVVEMRLRSVDGMNRLLEAAADIGATATHLLPTANGLRHRLATDGVGAFMTTRTASNSTKASLALYASSLAGAAIVLLAAGLAHVGVSVGAAAVVFTSALAIDAEAQRLLMAISGLRSQVLSLERLAAFATPREQAVLFSSETIGPFVSAAFRADPCGIHYEPVLIARGVALSVVGRSGAGKSQFLKSLAGVVASTPTSVLAGQPVPVVYVDGRWKQMLDNLDLDTVEGMVRALCDLCGGRMAPVLLAIDEALTDLSPVEAQKVVAETLARLGPDASVLLVDHRFALERTVNIEALASMPAERPCDEPLARA